VLEPRLRFSRLRSTSTDDEGTLSFVLVPFTALIMAGVVAGLVMEEGSTTARVLEEVVVLLKIHSCFCIQGRQGI